jgi:hypothetical protein
MKVPGTSSSSRKEMNMNGTLSHLPGWSSASLESPVPMAPLRGAPERELEHAKTRLLNQLLQEESYAQLQQPIRHAANEAAALAWMTPFPLLLLPILIQEKVQLAQQQAQHQNEVYRRSLPRRAPSERELRAA